MPYFSCGSYCKNHAVYDRKLYSSRESFMSQTFSFAFKDFWHYFVFHPFYRKTRTWKTEKKPAKKEKERLFPVRYWFVQKNPDK